MVLANFQGSINLGAGSRKVFTVTPGATLPIQFNVTNDFGGSYSIALNGLSTAGYSNPANHLVFTADGSWTSQSAGTYFTTAVSTTAPKLWTFNLQVKTNTPADYYAVSTQMAGLTSTRWAQQEQFYIQVIAATPPAPTILGPLYSSGSFAIQVVTVSGFTYYLERSEALDAPSWSSAAQAGGNGATITLQDPSPPANQAFYRVRVQ